MRMPRFCHGRMAYPVNCSLAGVVVVFAGTLRDDAGGRALVTGTSDMSMLVSDSEPALPKSDGFKAASGGIRLRDARGLGGAITLFLLVASAGLFFHEGFEALFQAWQLPEYSHGPLIPVLSGLIFLRELRTLPPHVGPINDRWPGVALLVFALLLGFLGKIARIPDIVAYALILFVGATILISHGWRRGRMFWPSVLHLVFMLPLPGVLYWKVSTTLQFISSEFGVWLIRLAGIPVYLDGNIIDLGIYKLHVAEACSGLRYLYPIMSFSYVFAVLYRGPIWHKAVLLVSAAPITVLMNSLRIGIIGLIVDRYGLAHVEGITHLLEGWVIFIASVLILFGMARLMLAIQGTGMTLSEALDLDTQGVSRQFVRLVNARVSPALVTALVLVTGATTAWHVAPERSGAPIERESFAGFPTLLGTWEMDSRQHLEPNIRRALGADDYYSATFVAPDKPAYVDVFFAWYRDQTRGGIHSPEVCLPAGGWEMAEIRRVDLQTGERVFPINRAIIQKGEQRLLVYFWFEQYGGRQASDYLAKAALLRDAVLHNRTDGALARLLTPILPGETVGQAEQRLKSIVAPALDELGRFVPHR